MTQQAIVIMGMTGIGKTPFGEFLELNGFFGRTCLHFDFGDQLRNAQQNGCELLSAEELRVINNVLLNGALLEDSQFGIIRKIFDRCIDTHHIREDYLVVLNGIPRHIGQAEGIHQFLTVERIILLDSSRNTIMQRIIMNSGGDRDGRTDDNESLIREKIRIFNSRTAPLFEYYQSRGIPIQKVPVGLDTTPKQIYSML